MKFRYLLVALLTSLLCTNGPLLAQDKHSDVPPVAVLKAALDLSEDQIREISELVRARAEAVRSISEQIHVLERQLAEATRRDAPDSMEVGDLVLETRMLRQQTGQHQANFRVAFEMLLTPRQIEQIGQIHHIALAVRAANAANQRS